MTKTITAMLGIAVFAAVLFGSAVLAPQAFAGIEEDPRDAGKVTICHNGDDGPETIEVSGNAVDKHLEKHGDSLGECVAPACADCLISAQIARDECINAGGSDAECFVEIEPSLTECSLMCEGTELEKEEACFTATLVQFFTCQIEGGMAEQCEENAGAFFEECTGYPLPG